MEHPENSEAYKGLVVNKGIEQPSSVNPYLKRKPKRRQLSVGLCGGHSERKCHDSESGCYFGRKHEAGASDHY